MDSGAIVESEINTNLGDQSEVEKFEADWKEMWKPHLESLAAAGGSTKPLGFDEIHKALEISGADIPPLTIEELPDMDS